MELRHRAKRLPIADRRKRGHRPAKTANVKTANVMAIFTFELLAPCCLSGPEAGTWGRPRQRAFADGKLTSDDYSGSESGVAPELERVPAWNRKC